MLCQNCKGRMLMFISIILVCLILFFYFKINLALVMSKYYINSLKQMGINNTYIIKKLSIKAC